MKIPNSILFRGYKTYERPAENETDTVPITMTFFLQQIVDLEEMEQNLITAFWVEQVFKNYLLNKKY